MLFLFNNSLGETHYGAMGVTRPVVGVDGPFLDKMVSALSKNFPAGTVLQFVHFASADVDEIIETYRNGKLDASPILRDLACMQADHIRAGCEEPLIKASGVLARRSRVFFGIKVPVSGTEIPPEELQEVLGLIESAFDGINAGQVGLERINEKQYRAFVAAAHDPWVREASAVPPWNKEQTLDEQILPIATAINYRHSRKLDTIEFNDGTHYAKVLSVNFLPDRAGPWIMNDFIGEPSGIHNQITDPFYLSLTLVYPSQEKAKAAMMFASTAVNNQSTPTIMKMIPEVGRRKRRIDVMVKETGQIVDATLTLVVYSKNETRLERLANTLVAYYSTLGGYGEKFDVRVDKRIIRTAFEQALPLNGTAAGLAKTYRVKSMRVKHAVRFLPIFGDYVQPLNGSGSLVLTRRGEPVTLDTFISNTNYNGAIYGESGSGKSQRAQEWLLDLLASGGRAWAVDDGRSLEKLCLTVGGQLINFSKNSGICVNPFTTIRDGELMEEMSLLTILLTRMAAPNDGLGDDKIPYLQTAIKQTYETYGSSASVREVAEFLNAQEDEAARLIGKQLFPFAFGQYAKWFVGPANVNLSADLVVLEVSDLKEIPHLKDVVVLQLFTAITREMRKVGKSVRKGVLVEEAKQHLLDPTMAKGIEELTARARKDEGAAVIVSQSILDVLLSPAGISIMNNLAWHMILEQKAESIELALEHKALNLDPYGANLLKSVHTRKGQFAEFMYKRSDGYGVYRSVSSEFMKVMFSTSGAERSEVLGAIEAGVPAARAIHEFIARRKASATASGAKVFSNALAE